MKKNSAGEQNDEKVYLQENIYIITLLSFFDFILCLIWMVGGDNIMTILMLCY